LDEGPASFAAHHSVSEEDTAGPEAPSGAVRRPSRFGEIKLARITPVQYTCPVVETANFPLKFLE
jgi:hypothetical protein